VPFEFDITVEIDRIQEQLSKLIEKVASSAWNVPPDREKLHPPVDVWETENALMMQIELPDIDSSTLKVYIHGGVLHVEGVKVSSYSAENNTLFHAFERRFGKFDVDIGIPCPVQIKRIAASFQDGIVEIIIPKIEERRKERCLVVVKIG